MNASPRRVYLKESPEAKNRTLETIAAPSGVQRGAARPLGKPRETKLGRQSAEIGPAASSPLDEGPRRKMHPAEEVLANKSAAAESPRHYQRGQAPTEAGSLLYADGFLAFASFAMALAGFVFIAAILSVNMVYSRPFPSGSGLFSLATLALCACGGIAAGILLVLHSSRFQPRRKLSFAAIACWLVPGALLLAAGLPSYPALSRILPLACLTLSLACLIKVFLEAWVHRRSEIFSMVDPGFYDQLTALTREGNLLFAAAAAVLGWAALILWRLAL